MYIAIATVPEYWRPWLANTHVSYRVFASHSSFISELSFQSLRISPSGTSLLGRRVKMTGHRNSVAERTEKHGICCPFERQLKNAPASLRLLSGKAETIDSLTRALRSSFVLHDIVCHKVNDVYFSNLVSNIRCRVGPSLRLRMRRPQCW